jgi:hypothetical protein
LKGNFTVPETGQFGEIAIGGIAPKKAIVIDIVKAQSQVT